MDGKNSKKLKLICPNPLLFFWKCFVVYLLYFHVKYLNILESVFKAWPDTKFNLFHSNSKLLAARAGLDIKILCFDFVFTVMFLSKLTQPFKLLPNQSKHLWDIKSIIISGFIFSSFSTLLTLYNLKLPGKFKHERRGY